MSDVKSWTLEEGLELIRQLHPSVQQAGYYLGLTGSVLFKGQSEKDLDIIAYPKSKPDGNPEALRTALREQGLYIWLDSDFIRERWREKGSNDTKHVEAWKTENGKRIDLFILS